MSTSTRLTLAQYEAMIARGEFEPREEHKVELLYGEIVPMSPIGPPHTLTVARLVRWSIQATAPDAVYVFTPGVVAVQALESEPEPDLSWTVPGDYHDRHPRPDEVLLLIEVSDSSLPKDRGLKARLYAEAGIRDYWVVNVRDRCVEVRRDPVGGEYRTVRVVRPGENVRPLALPDAALAVSSIFPT